MTPAEIREAVHRAIEALPEECYDSRSLEYSDAYPCPRCDLRQAEIDLGALLAADCDRMVTP